MVKRSDILKKSFRKFINRSISLGAESLSEALQLTKNEINDQRLFEKIFDAEAHNPLRAEKHTAKDSILILEAKYTN
jgi:hypothetical protein